MVNTVHNNGHNTRLFETVFRNVSQDTAKGNWWQQQRLETFAYSHIKQNQTNANHNYVATCQSRKTWVCPNRSQSDDKCLKHRIILLLAHIGKISAFFNRSDKEKVHHLLQCLFLVGSTNWIILISTPKAMSTPKTIVMLIIEISHWLVVTEPI